MNQSLRIALICLVASSALGQPPPSREAIEAGLRSRRADLLQHEAAVQTLRDELKGQLADPVPARRGAMLRAEKQVVEARLAREAAEFALVEYVEGRSPADESAAKGKASLANKVVLVRLGRLDQMKDFLKRGIVNPLDLNQAEIDHQQAVFDAEQAEAELRLLTQFTRPREAGRRRAAVDQARAAEREAQARLDLERATLGRLVDRVGRSPGRSPEDLVVSLLDEAIQAETRVVALLGEARTIEAKKDAPAEILARLQAIRTESAASMDRAKLLLRDAEGLANDVRTLRANLRDAEAELKKERDALANLERP